MSAPPRTKAEVRREMLEARRALSRQQRADRSRAIARRLFELPLWERARSVHLFIGAVDGEVETREIALRGFELGKRILCPRVRWDPPGLDSFEIRSLDDLEEGPRGLWEPAPGRARKLGPDPDVGLVLVPGLAFDRLGHRIGYGAGFYDRFLAGTAAPRVALAYSLQVIDRVPAEAHDEPVHRIVTEIETIVCEPGPASAAREAGEEGVP